MFNLRISIAYDGARYLGWQKTKEGGSIEETLQTVLEQILQHPVELNGASRTDAGVHALGQTANFHTGKKRDLPTLQRSINALLPPDIRVLSLEEAPVNFHATLDCLAKEYHYWICAAPVQLPHLRYTSWHYPYTLDRKAMEQGSRVLEGVHDFRAFCNVKKNETYEDTIREVEKIEVVFHPEERVQLILKGSRFLYKMARNLAGTLAVAGRERLSSDTIRSILKNKDRTQAPLTAPAHGLTLFKTSY